MLCEWKAVKCSEIRLNEHENLRHKFRKFRKCWLTVNHEKNSISFSSFETLRRELNRNCFHKHQHVDLTFFSCVCQNQGQRMNKTYLNESDARAFVIRL